MYFSVLLAGLLLYEYFLTGRVSKFFIYKMSPVKDRLISSKKSVSSYLFFNFGDFFDWLEESSLSFLRYLVELAGWVYPPKCFYVDLLSSFFTILIAFSFLWVKSFILFRKLRALELGVCMPLRLTRYFLPILSTSSSSSED